MFWRRWNMGTIYLKKKMQSIPFHPPQNISISLHSKYLHSFLLPVKPGNWPNMHTYNWLYNTEDTFKNFLTWCNQAPEVSSVSENRTKTMKKLYVRSFLKLFLVISYAFCVIDSLMVILCRSVRFHVKLMKKQNTLS